jgi:hypothetical protein
VRDLLPFSPAKTGPFSGKGYPLYSGMAISESLAEGITKSAPKLQSAMKGLLGPLSVATSTPEITVPRTSAAVGSNASATTQVINQVSVAMTVSVDDLAKMTKIGDFLQQLDSARVVSRKVARSGMVAS